MMTQAYAAEAIKYQSYLAFQPLEVIRHTLLIIRHKWIFLCDGRRKVQTLFPSLNQQRISFFTSKDDLSGARCAQIFDGLCSHFMYIYSLKTEADGPQAF